MAHECPDCGSICYCHGDIDDMLLNFDEDLNSCTCCLHDCGSDDDEYDEDYDDE